ncbi:carnitine 3-dehydrogenase [uncultured Thiothrix sp.]|uniref:carnitine 3-dehydrogenase n=1 Tax=uncultured Thiothrix sp. TaxID=223185 RepID=UPI00261C01D7|nr:carnitine 3-dehydrogenase [uncultured Thiothrix sp.]
MQTIKQAAVVGGGVIGAGWVARLIENGINVSIYDPDPTAPQKIDAVLANSRHAYSKLTMAPRRTEGQFSFAKDIASAVKAADWIVEAVPERLDLKQKIYREIEGAAPHSAIIASSTSGILPTDLQAGLQHPERLLVAHPFNPVYLLPLVELVGGKQTSADTVQRAQAFYRSIGMHPLHIKKEIEAFIADRLLEAVWRESLWLVSDGIASTEDVDDAIRYGFGLRWAQMGLFETYRIAGGEAGMRHFMEQFGPCLSWPWTKLTDVPEFNDQLVDLIAGQSDAQSGHYSIRQLERIRDNNLIAILQALKAHDWGAGKALAVYEKSQYDAAASQAQTAVDYSQPIKTVERTVPTDWTDYNNHMNESRYLQVSSDATDAFMRLIGVDAAYVEAGGSYFTVETHIRHLDEVRALEPIVVTTQVLNGSGKKLHLFNRIQHADGRLLATAEHMLIHVSLKTRSSSLPSEAIAQKLAEIAQAQAHLPKPDGAGRAIGA